MDIVVLSVVFGLLTDVFTHVGDRTGGAHLQISYG